jgi:hypothetical protein
MKAWTVRSINDVLEYFGYLRNKWQILKLYINLNKKSKTRQITLALTTVYIGRKFRTNTIRDPTNQISDAVFIGITISLVNIAWTCT